MLSALFCELQAIIDHSGCFQSQLQDLDAHTRLAGESDAGQHRPAVPPHPQLAARAVGAWCSRSGPCDVQQPQGRSVGRAGAAVRVHRGVPVRMWFFEEKGFRWVLCNCFFFCCCCCCCCCLFVCLFGIVFIVWLFASPSVTLAFETVRPGKSSTSHELKNMTLAVWSARFKGRDTHVSYRDRWFSFNASS
jgi:hypothetical protein